MQHIYTHTLHNILYNGYSIYEPNQERTDMENVQNVREREKKKERHIPCIVSGFIFATNEEYGMERKNATTFQKTEKI